MPAAYGAMHPKRVLVPLRSLRGHRPYAPSTEGPCVTFGRADPSAPTTKPGRPPAALFYPQPEVAPPFKKFFRRNLKLMDKSPRLPV